MKLKEELKTLDQTQSQKNKEDVESIQKLRDEVERERGLMMIMRPLGMASSRKRGMDVHQTTKQIY